MPHHQLRCLPVLVGVVWPVTSLAASADDCCHDRVGTRSVEAVRDSAAFKVSFDTDQNVDGIALGVPDRNAHELRRDGRSAGGKSHKRASRWSTDPEPPGFRGLARPHVNEVAWRPHECVDGPVRNSPRGEWR